MGLDIIPCCSDDWQKSLNALKLREEFGDSINFKEWYSDWYNKHGEEYEKLVEDGVLYDSDCTPYEDDKNSEIYNQKLREFCEKNGLSWTEDEYTVEIDPGIRDFYDYSMRSSYNDYGTNNVLRRLDIDDFYDIFGINDSNIDTDFSYIPVDWNLASERAQAAINELTRKKDKIQDGDFDYVVGQLRKVIAFAEFVKEENKDPGYYRVYWSY